MNSKTSALRARLNQPGLVVAPGVFDMVSLRMADSFGFDALYMTGYGTVASHMGLPDAGLATYSDMVGRVTAMAGMARTPLIADADTGYGGLLNMRHTIRGYEAAGACAIQLEDQEFPKKCGHTPGRRVIPMADMVRKIQVAVDSRDSKDFLIIARTDARTTLGLDEYRVASGAGEQLVQTVACMRGHGMSCCLQGFEALHLIGEHWLRPSVPVNGGLKIVLSLYKSLCVGLQEWDIHTANF